jgi:hypothetical protein
VTAGPDNIAIEKVRVLVPPAEEVTRIVNDIGLVAVVGVPVINPPALLRDRPSGRFPDCIDQV